MRKDKITSALESVILQYQETKIFSFNKNTEIEVFPSYRKQIRDIG